MNILEWAIAIMVCLIVWNLIGCMVLALVDTQGALLSWTSSAPYGLGCLVVLLWPAATWLYLR